MAASVRWALKDGALWISTPYHASFVEQLKECVPSHDRKWNAERKVWVVHPRYKDQVHGIIFNIYGVDLEEPEVRGPGFTSPNQSAPPPGGSERSPREVQLQRELARARAEIQHLEAVIRSLNIDMMRTRMMNGDRSNGSDVLSKVLRSEHGAKAWKKLASVLHPDAGGDEELFKEIEAVWARIGK